MTRKEEFNTYANKLISENNKLVSSKKLHLDFVLPYSKNEHCETIIVPASYIKEKIIYINENYNCDLELKTNPKVKIIKFY